LSADLAALESRGRHVRVSTVRAQDVAPYRRAVEQSRQRLARWNPVDPDDLARHLTRQSRDHRTFLIHALNPEGDHDIVGKVNVTDAVRGRFQSAAMGYDAYDPYTGRGLFAEGLRLVVDLALARETAGGMGLHRVQAVVQPGNVRSAGLLRSLGFQREGFSPRMLWVPGVDGQDAWRDHVSYAVLRDDWPAQPYATAPDRRVVVLVNGVPGSGRTALARLLAAELGVPLFSQEVISQEDIAGRPLWALLEQSPVGGVVEGCFRPDDERSVLEGLQLCGLDPATVPEVWCAQAQAQGTAQAQGSARPLGLGPVVSVDTAQAIGPGEVVRIALQVGWGSGS
jgi:ribosomal-protein-alanine N-acetyltransferase